MMNASKNEQAKRLLVLLFPVYARVAIPVYNS